ncbi:MAG: radical SAM protein [Candidatus Bathyarchaeia archaeon]
MTLNQPVKKIRVSIGTAVILGLEMAFMNRDNAPTTAYLQTYYPGRCAANCKFCAQAKTSEAKVDKIARGLYLPYDAELVITRLKKAAKRKFIKRICIQTLNYSNLMNELLWVVNRLNAEVAAPISVSIFSVPAEQIKRLRDSGVQKIIIPLDAANEEIFDDIKGAKAAGPYRWESHLKAIHDAVEIMGKGNVGTHLMVGLGETEHEAVDLLAKLNDEGVYSALFAFTPIAGTRLAGGQPPSIESYRRIKLANYLIYQNLTRAEKMLFNESGEIKDFGIAKEEVEKTIAHGEPFLTSGCPDCNRPFANETPEKKIYNFPVLPSEEELREIKKQVNVSKGAGVK